MPMPDPHRSTIDVPPGWRVEIIREPCSCPEGFVCAAGDPFRPLCPRQPCPFRRSDHRREVPMTRTVSPAGRAALMAREGCRLSAYRDGVGVPTIGVGHTGRAGPPPVAMGMTVTRAEADAIFAADLAPFEAAVAAAVPASLGVNAFDACVSLAFNVGARGFAGSAVVHHLAAGDHTAAADAFLLWDRPPELAARRRAERAQFLRPDADPPEIPALQPPRPAVAGPHLLPPPAPGFWARLAARFTRKAA